MKQLLRFLFIAIMAINVVSCEKENSEEWCTFHMMSHILTGIDNVPYQENSYKTCREVIVPAEGISLTFMRDNHKGYQIDEISEHQLVNSDGDEVSTAFSYYLYKEYDAGKVLVSDEWCRIEFDNDMSIRGMNINIKPNASGAKRELRIHINGNTDILTLSFLQDSL